MKIEALGLYLGECDGWYTDEGYNFYRNYKPCETLKERFVELKLLQVEHDLKIIFDRNLNKPIDLEIINTKTKKVILTIQVTISALFERIQEHDK